MIEMKKKDQKWLIIGGIIFLIVLFVGLPQFLNGKNVMFEYKWAEPLCELHPSCDVDLIWTIDTDSGELMIAPGGYLCYCPPRPVPRCYDIGAKCRTQCLSNEEPSAGGNIGCPINMFCCMPIG